MDKKELKQAQKIMLDILRDVDAVCRKHSIHYFLDGGTMLGAVRHKGFIPWDDDLDIGMLRDQYDRFIKIAPKELPDKYYLQEWRSDPEYGFWFSKVRLRGTVFREKNGSKNEKHNEFFIDIFPYDNFPDLEDDRIATTRKIEFYKRCLLAKTGYSVWNTNNGFSLKRYLSYKCLKSLLMFTPKEKIVSQYSVTAQKYNTTKTKHVYPQGNSKSGKFHLERESFDTIIDVEFENETFPILKEYDRFLSTLYGDYMMLPPVEDRYNRHNVIEIVFQEE